MWIVFVKQARSAQALLRRALFIVNRRVEARAPSPAVRGLLRVLQFEMKPADREVVLCQVCYGAFYSWYSLAAVNAVPGEHVLVIACPCSL